MMKPLTFLPLIVISCFLWSCKSQDASSSNKTELGLPSSNGSTVLIAKVLEIYDEKTSTYPCSEVACMAKVRIEKVVISSANTLEPFSSGQEGKMRFEFSLSKTTKKLFPNLDKRLPGLNAGDRFKVNAIQEVVFGSGDVQWVALEYILLP